MPAALVKVCGGCGQTFSGHCPQCSQRRDQQRHHAAARGYDAYWQRFRLWFIAKLAAFGIAPVCGSRWPGQPATGDSRCQREGRQNGDRLHVDHTPPLTAAERMDRRAVCDVKRVQLLCETCHNAKTGRENW
jgi:5-methylcytosine-specific restriction endonuclease McrA